MKTIFSLLTAGILATGLVAFGQNTPQPQGRGRGGAPYAWCDQNRDGICDRTGKPVGQGRGQMAPGSRCGRNQGRCANCRGANANPQPTPAPAPSK
jgi:hypothetical protein